MREHHLYQLLKDDGINFLHNQSFKDVQRKRRLRFDFILKIENQPLFIEVDGIQHIQPTTFGGISMERAIKNFEQTKIYDNIKNTFCQENKYPLLRINHKTKYKNYNFIVKKFILENTLKCRIINNRV